ncbi:Tex-like N-terminal domain-containing protein [Mycoplasmopsis adleri]|uniref:Tex-like N-terminal domain-containing protein n=1 Tax=Mycoplasmopsis adleri TaxID=51362 RepID=UPI0038732C40
MDLSIKYVANKLNLKEEQVEVVLDLLKNDATVPFIARYRKNVTGGLDEEVINNISDMYNYNVELNKRKEAVINILKENKLLTPELEQKINAAETKAEVENIYEPFKVGKKTKATEAIALGLEPLALAIMNATDPKFNPYKEAQKYVNDKVPMAEFAIEQAKFIISQIMSQDANNREFIKHQIYDYGTVQSKVKKNAEDEKENFKQYYDFSQRVNKIPNYRVLAIARGGDLKILSYDIVDYNIKKITYDLNEKYFKIKTTGKILNEALKDSLDRLLIPSIIREIKSELFERAEKEAIKLFAENVETMLLFPAVKDKTVMAIDPAYINGCKIAILNPQGTFLEKALIFPTTNSDFKIKEAKTIVNKLIDKYKVNIIVIGNGTASRETEAFIANIIKERKKNNPNEELQYAVVSEVGASVYSASPIAQEEFPNLHVEERSAINIGRRFQDPLNELIKIDPKSIGVGQYQHDVNQKELNKALSFKVDKAVNLVGVDLNSATKEILCYVSGLSKKLAENIVAYRNENKKFKNRKELLKVPGVGPKAYEQAIGFLRIHDSKTFYDRTNIHPESYALADKIVNELNIDLSDIDTVVLEKANIKELAKKFDSNEYDVQLIVSALLNPTKDIRDEKDGYVLKDDILKLEDLKPGMLVQGSVQNITDFGIFVYIGIKQAVLIHISQMKRNPNEKINHPKDAVKVGDNITVEILSIDKDKEKIQGKLIYK